MWTIFGLKVYPHLSLVEQSAMKMVGAFMCKCIDFDLGKLPVHVSGQTKVEFSVQIYPVAQLQQSNCIGK